MGKFKLLSGKRINDYIRKIARNDEASTQLRRELVESTKRDSDFISYVKTHIGFDDDQTRDIRLDPKLKFTEQQYRSASFDDEMVISSSIRDCSAYLATTPEYWGGLTIALIESGLIHAHYLASKPNDSRNERNRGKYRIDAALKANKYDDLPRYILRSFCGHPRLRDTGYRDYFQFCPVSRAWWRCRLADVSSGRNGIESSVIHKTLINKGVWNHLSEKGVSKLTVISDVNIFSGMVHFFVSKNVASEKECKEITGYIGAQSTWRELGAYSAADVSHLISEHRG